MYVLTKAELKIAWICGVTSRSNCEIHHVTLLHAVESSVVLSSRFKFVRRELSGNALCFVPENVKTVP